MSAFARSGSARDPARQRGLKWSLSAIVVVALSITLRGGFMHFVLAFACVAYVILPWYLAGWAKRLWLPFVGRGQSNIPRGIRRNPGLFVTMAILVAVSFVPGCAIEKHRIVAAKHWAVAVAPSVERYRAEHGWYPIALEQLRDLPELPWFVHDGDLHYERRDGRFEFDLWTGPLSGDSWRSDEREWRHYH